MLQGRTCTTIIAVILKIRFYFSTITYFLPLLSPQLVVYAKKGMYVCITFSCASDLIPILPLMNCVLLSGIHVTYSSEASKALPTDHSFEEFQ